MKDGHLIVQATDGSDTFEIVPSSALRGNYPDHFRDDYVLWYNAAKTIVEFRPTKDPWNSGSALKWTLSQNDAAAR